MPYVRCLQLKAEWLEKMAALALVVKKQETIIAAPGMTGIFMTTISPVHEQMPICVLFRPDLKILGRL